MNIDYISSCKFILFKRLKMALVIYLAEGAGELMATLTIIMFDMQVLFKSN